MVQLAPRDHQKPHPSCYPSPSLTSTWITPPTSHQIETLNTKKMKYERKPNLSLLLKRKRKEKDIRDRMLNNQIAYEEKLFKGKRMSNLQKYLKSLHKTKQFPDEMYYTITAKGQSQKQKHIPTPRSEICSTTSSPMSSSTKGKYGKNKHTQNQSSIILPSPKMKSKNSYVTSR